MGVGVSEYSKMRRWVRKAERRRSKSRRRRLAGWLADWMADWMAGLLLAGCSIPLAIRYTDGFWIGWRCFHSQDRPGSHLPSPSPLWGVTDNIAQRLIWLHIG